MKKRLFVTFVVAVFAMAVGIFAVSAQDDFSGHTVVLTTAEYLTIDGEGHGVTFYVSGANFNLLQRDSGNGQLSQDFVYNDPRNNQFDGNQPSVSVGIVPNLSSDAGLGDGGAYWMSEAYNVWDRQQCSDMGLVPVAVDPGFPGIVNIFFQTGTIPLIQSADLTQMGFFSGVEFPYFAANPNVLGVAFTLSWVDADGNLTDIDNNGKSDVAFREIYYNDEFEWVQDGILGERGDGVFDFPAVAIHEVGHGFSAAHFGSIGRDADGNIVAHPTSIMNAIYGGIQRELTGRDRGSHCSNWAQWPNR